MSINANVAVQQKFSANSSGTLSRMTRFLILTLKLRMYRPYHTIKVIIMTVLGHVAEEGTPIIRDLNVNCVVRQVIWFLNVSINLTYHSLVSLTLLLIILSLQTMLSPLMT
ncbi:hypothetical protein Gotur_019767 [Gossypium turneri]